MLNLISISIATSLITIVGIAILSVFKHKMYLLEKLAYGYLLGSGTITLVIYIIGLQSIALSTVNIFTVVGLIASASIILLLNNKYLFINIKVEKSLKNNAFVKSFNTITLVHLITMLASNMYWPISAWDAIALYDIRAKLIISNNSLAAGMSELYYTTHPMMTSLLHTWYYQFDIQNVAFIYPLIFISFLITIYFSSIRISKNAIGSIITLAISTVPVIYFQAHMAYSNVPHMVYAIIGIILMFNWIKKDSNGLILSSIFMGFSIWIRSEDILWVSYLLIILMASILLKRKLKSIIIPTIVVLATYFLWTNTRDIFLANDVGGNIIQESPKYLLMVFNNIDLSKILQVGKMIYSTNIANNKMAYVLLVLLAIPYILKKKYVNAIPIYAGLYIITTVIIQFFAMYVFSFLYSGWSSLSDSLSRMSMYIIPLSLYSINYYWKDFKQLFYKTSI